MDYTVRERILMELLLRAMDEYNALERNEGHGPENDRETFIKGITQAITIVESRARRRNAS